VFMRLSGTQKIISTKCRINTVVSPDDGHIIVRNMSRLVNINILIKTVHQVGFIYKIVLLYILLYSFIHFQQGQTASQTRGTPTLRLVPYRVPICCYFCNEINNQLDATITVY